MIKFAVCDDEPFMLEELAARLTKYMEEMNLDCQISCFASGIKLIESGGLFDVSFLDIQMDGADGMETARRLRDQGYCGLLIFMTVMKERVFDAFEVQAFDYLVKPLDNRRFLRTMDRAVRTLQQEAEKNMIVQSGTACEVVPFSQIVYCEVFGRKIYLHRHGGETMEYYDRLGNLERRLDRRFFRCHRSYLVNLDYVRGCNRGLVALAEGGNIPVSRLREQEFLQALLDHMKERRCQDGLV